MMSIARPITAQNFVPNLKHAAVSKVSAALLKKVLHACAQKIKQWNLYTMSV